MAKSIHKGTELNNVRETWEQNEKQPVDDNTQESSGSTELEETIREEAKEYDEANKEDRILSGDRASVRDEDSDQQDQ